MAALSRDAAYGIFAAWMLGLPLEISGHEVFISDATAHALFPDMTDEEPASVSEPASEVTAATGNPHPHRDLARRCAFYMDIAAREIERLGVEVGALDRSNFSGAPDGTG
jgi:hypothetical protein